MTTLRLTPVIDDAALGTFVNSRVTGSFKYFNHNGGNDGFQCTAIGCRDSGEGVVIMTNSDNGSLLYEEIANSVATVYNWKDYYLPEVVKVVNVEGSVLDKYVGKYITDGTIITFIKSDNALLVNEYSGIWWNVYFTSDSDFFIREYRGITRFTTDKDNKVTGFSMGDKLAKKIE
jgi:hypothetical protein